MLHVTADNHQTLNMRDDQSRHGLVCLKVNKLHGNTHHSGGLLIFVKMKKHFLQYNIELFPLPDEINNGLYYKGTGVLLENTPLVKFIRNCIRYLSGVFSNPH